MKPVTIDPYDLSRGVNTFGSTLFSNLDKDARTGDAAFLSPWGVSHVLAMLLEGAPPGTTSHQQIQKALFTANPPDHEHSMLNIRHAFQSLTKSLTASSNGTELTVSDASSAWVKPDVQLLEGYVEALNVFYEAQARPLTSAAVVNSWVDRQTRGKITSIISEEVAQRMALVLVNAIYFKGKWLEPFKKASTYERRFNLFNGTEMYTQMMYQHYERGAAIQAAKFQAPSSTTGKPIDCVAVKLPYKGGTYSAVISMPEGNSTSQGPEGLIIENGENYLTALSACREAVVSGLAPAGTVDGVGLPWQSIGAQGIYGIHVYLPRFEVEFQANLTDALKSAGLDAIFRYGDFTKMTSAGDMEVSDVVQKVYVKVDEAGTEAAAVTAAFCYSGCCMDSAPPPELVVIFDRPFVFTIVHEASGMALFAGEVYKPEEWKQEQAQ